MNLEEAQQLHLSKYTDFDCNALITDFDDTLTVCFDRREVFGTLFVTYGGNGVDAEERLLFNAVIRGKTTFVDVGANIGFYTLLAAKHMATSAAIVAVEPANSNYRYLMANILLNRFETRATVAKCAIAETPGMGSLNVAPVGFQVGNSLRVREHGWSSQPVVLQTLDGLCDQYKLRSLDVLKLDAEGYEENILRGGKDTLRRNRGSLSIICELNSRIYTAKQLDELIALLKSEGGRTYTFDHERREVRTSSDLTGPVTNVICI